MYDIIDGDLGCCASFEPNNTQLQQSANTEISNLIVIRRPWRKISAALSLNKTPKLILFSSVSRSCYRVFEAISPSLNSTRDRITSSIKKEWVMNDGAYKLQHQKQTIKIK